jgi:hypothetical protein
MLDPTGLGRVSMVLVDALVVQVWSWIGSFSQLPWIARILRKSNIRKPIVQVRLNSTPFLGHPCKAILSDWRMESTMTIVSVADLQARCRVATERRFGDFYINTCVGNQTTVSAMRSDVVSRIQTR